MPNDPKWMKKTALEFLKIMNETNEPHPKECQCPICVLRAAFEVAAKGDTSKN